MPQADSGVNVPVALPWVVTCEVACLAMINNLSFEDAVSYLLVKMRNGYWTEIEEGIRGSQ